jgi:hypothetical protein
VADLIKVVSVSLGSSRRDMEAEVDLRGKRVLVQRVGTNGDMRRAEEMIRDLDGKVDALGLGGIDLYIWAGKRRYAFRDAQRLARAARVTPVVDGSGLKNTLERWVIRYLSREAGIQLAGKKVLMVCAVDRFGMAETLVEAGAEMIFGDLVFALGIPLPLRRLRDLHLVASIAAPVITKLPFKWVYPTGEKQNSNPVETREAYVRLYQWADLIAGDFHFIRRFMPKDLAGKTIITNTVTAEDVAELRRRGALRLVTTTPDICGRSLGTNVVEAMAVAMEGRRPEEMTPDDYLHWLQGVGFKPRIEDLNN